VGSARRLVPIAGVAAALLSPRAATGDGAPCVASTAGWVANRGSLAPGLACGSFIGATDAWSGPFSRGEFLREQPVSAPFSMQVTSQRLGPDGDMSLSLFLRGGIVLLKRGAYGFYAFSESAFQWHDLPGFSPQRESTVKVEQREHEIAVWIDGARAFVLPFAAPRSPGAVGIGMKGERGHRSRMRFRDFSLTRLR
jgi:hypothetical protein